MTPTLAGIERPATRVKELSERDRRRLLMHFLALDNNDRLLRFGSAGSVVSDEAITRYVQTLDFTRDAVFGVYDDSQQLLGTGHLVFALRECNQVLRTATSKARLAEFGVSVLASARGRGIGTKLFERAVVHCRNEDVDTLYLCCRSANTTIMHIARRVGMEVHCDRNETAAYLKIMPADPNIVLHAAVEEQLPPFDQRYTVNSRRMEQWRQRFAARDK